MKAWLLLVNALYFLFGASMYMGTMWVLRFFLYPDLADADAGQRRPALRAPTILATKFFTVVVPPMFLSGIVLVVTEWGDRLVLARRRLPGRHRGAHLRRASRSSSRSTRRSAAASSTARPG